jgi:hypothetical protein
VCAEFEILGSGDVLETFWLQGETFWRFWRLWEPLQNRINFADVCLRMPKNDPDLQGMGNG